MSYIANRKEITEFSYKNKTSRPRSANRLAAPEVNNSAACQLNYKTFESLLCQFFGCVKHLKTIIFQHTLCHHNIL